MVFTRSADKFSTRLTVEHQNIEQVPVAKLFGLETVKKFAKSLFYSTLSMITKLRYVGASMEDLLDIYILFVRSVTEYFQWHSI